MRPLIAPHAQRLRSRAVWAFSLATVCLVASVIGLVQYFHSGAVSIRPGHETLGGRPALESLALLALAGIGFAAIGTGLASRAKRQRKDG